MDTFLYPILADSEKNAKKLEEKYARKYPIFYDPSKKVPKMLKQEIKLIKGGRMPGLLILDKAGIIRFAYFGESMHDIPKNDVLFEVLAKI
jgi:hypothetical protein